MVVVGGGSSSRFGADKLLADVEGSPLIAHTIRSVLRVVDRCVLVCRKDQLETVRALGLGVQPVSGGETRTGSEIAGLNTLADGYELIGIHDAARPLASRDLMERLFTTAARVGGAIPVLRPNGLLVDRESLTPLSHARAVQTPQVFRATELLAAYRHACDDGLSAHDTADVVSLYSSLDIAAVPGEESNLKVTYPEDLDRVRRTIRETARSEPR